MKKILLLPVFLALAFSSFAQKAPDGSLFIEGKAQVESNIEFFSNRFIEEATAAGYTVTESGSEAAYTFKYEISEINEMAESNEPVIKINIINNADGEEILNFEYIFNDIYEMYDYIQFLFQKASISIPLPRRNDLIDIGWQNKLLYIRLSFDYPITFYALQPDGLIGGIGVYNFNDENKPMVSPEDNKVLVMPGATVGLEFQFLNFMSFELNLQLSLGDPRNNYFINLAAGAELKFPLKFFQHIVIEPYAAFTYPIITSDVFSEFPLFMIGGGIQVGAKGGKNASFFVNTGFMLSLTKAGMKNPYGELFPEPPVIYYNHYVFKLAIGYKFGLIDRKNGKLLVNYY